MQLICATFRPLFLENICSRLLRNQMIVMLISHFHNILNAPVVFDHIPLFMRQFGSATFTATLKLVSRVGLP